MAQHNDLGKLGEEEAVKYLKGLGYEILDLNCFSKLYLPKNKKHTLKPVKSKL